MKGNREKTAQTCLRNTLTPSTHDWTCVLFYLHIYDVFLNTSRWENKYFLKSLGDDAGRWHVWMAVWMFEQTAQKVCQLSFIQLMSCQAREILNLWIWSFQQLWHFTYFTFWASLKQSATDAEYKDLEHDYMSLCTQIYIRNDIVRQYHDFHYVYIHINPLSPYILQRKETPLPRQASVWRSNYLWWLKTMSVADTSDRLAQFHELQLVHPLLMFR